MFSFQGLLSRYEYTKNGKSCHVLANLGFGFSDSNQLALPSGVTGKLRFKQADRKFTLMSNQPCKNYKIVIEKVYVEVFALEPKETVFAGIEKVLRQDEIPAIYSFSDTVVKSFVQNSGIASVDELQLCEGDLPYKVHVNICIY